ncbi:DUF1579 domain-containing protein [Chitinophaga sp. YIM B06452]|uniref:DUF1579 domain-containing protein n=1 Tax=Chitinophaga sp. YIM B06452 TaxID=3082158 RepID=UPI0031FEFEB4
MKRILLALTAMITALSAHSQDEAAMKAWMDYATPGSMQKMIAMADGNWKTDMTFWMAPGAPPMTTTGTCTNKMVMGGRYQESRFTSSMDGQPFEGVGMLGYDNVRKVFVSTWLDNMGTGIMYLEGKWDDATRSITFTGNMTDAVAGKAMPVREVFKWVDDNNQVMEMYQMSNGTEYKSMELKFTRK